MSFQDQEIRVAVIVEGISFHDSTLLRIREVDGTTSLDFEQVYVDAEIRTASVHLYNVTTILRNGDPVDRLIMESEDGEVLDLDSTSTSLHLVVTWHDPQRLERTRTYDIECESLSVEIC
jgi:hypothetical protein